MAKGFKDFPPAAQVGILALGALLVVGLSDYYKVYPLLDQRAKLEEDVKKLAADNKRDQAFEQEQTQYRIKIAQLQTQLETQRLLLPDTESLDEFMTMVFKKAAEAGIHVRTFLPQPIAPRDYYVEAPFRVHLDGTYWGLRNYFDQLAKEQRIVSVTSITIGGPMGGGMGAYTVSSNETVGADCVLVTYFNKTATPTAGTTAKK